MIHTTCDGIRLVVIQVIVQLAISGAELLLLQEQCVVHQGQSVEDVELKLLGEDQGVVDQGIQALL